LLRKDRKISFEGAKNRKPKARRKKNNKKGETKIEHGKSSGGVGGGWKCLILRRSNHTPHSIASSPKLTPRCRVIELAEGKIGFFGYRNRTKPVRRVSGAFSVATAFFFWCFAATLAFVEAASTHIVFSTPPSTPSRLKFPMCVQLYRSGFDNG
jgi:hypothetical protein